MPVVRRERNEADVTLDDAFVYPVAAVLVPMERETVGFDYGKEFRIGTPQAWQGILKPAVLL